MITFRIDVDYQSPSRIKSFIYTATGLKAKNDYLRNAKIIAKMINESRQEVKAYWFFTPRTIPDEQLLKLLDNSKHEVALHVVNNPYREWNQIEKATGKKINYYTIHGTARLLARIMWKRWKKLRIPPGFPLQSFHQFPTEGLDRICYSHPMEQAIRIIEDCIKKGQVVYFHPVWLFQRGKMNRRGPFYRALARILEVDKELETVSFKRKLFFTIARDAQEYVRNIVPTQEFIAKLRDRGADLFAFLERKWCFKIQAPSEDWIKSEDNIALLLVTSYQDWWKIIGKKTRNMVRKAEKSGVRTEVVEPNEKFAEGLWRIYNETPIRQGRSFPHYGISSDSVRRDLSLPQESTHIGAYFEGELIGFTQLVYGDNITLISKMLSLQEHWDKAVNNALIAKAVEVCSNKQVHWIMYGRMGNHPSLDNFKESNGFTKFMIARYHVPLTKRGRIATKLGLHAEMKDSLPTSIKYPLIPAYNWVSRTRTRILLKLKKKKQSNVGIS